MYNCKILLDSISETGKRLTTMEITFPRCVLAEAETHRMFRGFSGNVEELVIHNLGINVDENFSRNSASSRAIPINKMLEMVMINPFIPEKFGKPVKGMGAKEYWPINEFEHIQLTQEVQKHLQDTIKFVGANVDIANKEDLNRYLEPFMWHTAIITATEWDNFFKLRTNEAADWKIRKIADLMYEAYHSNLKEYEIAGNLSTVQIKKLNVGEWHCPLVSEEDNSLIGEYLRNLTPSIRIYEGETSAFEGIRKRISVARCARVSYLTHDGKRDIEKDLELFERLRTMGHWSPFEHVATPYYEQYKSSDYAGSRYTHPVRNDLSSGNFIGWKQFRKEFQDENCTNFRKEN